MNNNFEEAKSLLIEKNLTIQDLQDYFSYSFKKTYKTFCIGFVLCINLFSLILIGISGDISGKIYGAIAIAVITISITFIAFKVASSSSFLKIMNPYNVDDELNSYYFLDKSLSTNRTNLEKFLNRAIAYKNDK